MNTDVITLAKLGDLVSTVRQFCHELCAVTADGKRLETACAKLIGKFGLRPDDIGAKYLSKFSAAA